MVTFNIHKRQQGEPFEFELGRLSALVADMDAIQRGDSPESMTNGEAPVLDQWVMARRTIPCLAGLSSGHPRLVGSGRPIATSDLWLMSADRTWARTLSRWYALGRPAGHTDDHS